MSYDLPNEATLAKYMHLLQRVLIALRHSSDPQAAALAYAVHNLPDLLMRWPDMNEAEQAGMLRKFEQDFPQWKGHFTRILEEGAPPEWQLRWGPPSSSA